MVSQFLVHIFKKWLSRLACRSVSVLFSFLSLLRRLAAGYSGLRDRGPIIGPHFSPRSQGHVAADDVLVCPSHLPLDQTFLGHIPGSARNSTADLSHASPQAVPDLSTTPPASDGQPGSEVVTLYDMPLFKELLPEDIKRYQRKTQPAEISNTMIPANTRSFPVHDMVVPSGWTSIVHPEGCRYFVNQEKRVLTESNICDPKSHEKIEYGIEVLLNRLEPGELDMNQVDLVIESRVDDNDNDNDNVVLGYYFVNHHSRCIFWLDDFNVEYVFFNCLSLSHTGLAIQAQYWRHWDYFPSLCPVSQNLVDEVNDMLIYAKCDHLSSKRSCAPYDAVRITEYISVVDGIKVPPADQSMRRCHAAIAIGRIMYIFSHNAFMNFHGEDCARLSVDQVVLDWKYKPSLWMVIFTPILFLEPIIYVQDLHKIYADPMVFMSRWDAFSTRLKGQLQDSNLLATVLLSANVGFLGVIKGGPFIQMTSYMSLVASFGSIVLGLFFVSQDRISGQSTVKEAASFLIKLRDKKHGLESLAMIYSFPKALLMWGMVLFFVAFSMNWYSSGATLQELIAVYAVTLFVFIMIVVSIMRTKERHPWLPMALELLSDLADAFKWVIGITSARRDDDIRLSQIGSSPSIV